jgi:protein-tyrosine phosphatase
MESIHFPIIDKWIPDDLLAMIKCVLEMVSQVKRQRIMLVHCNGGKGRTGMLLFFN